jgi:hypothetical protein
MTIIADQVGRAALGKAAAILIFDRQKQLANVIVRPTRRSTGPLSATKACAVCFSPAPGTANATTPESVNHSVADQTE